MTKTITLPISHETCTVIKHAIGWFLWIGLVALSVYGLVYAWYDVGNLENGYEPTHFIDINLARIYIGAFSSIIIISQPLIMLNYLRTLGIWIKIECNCKETKNGSN